MDCKEQKALRIRTNMQREVFDNIASSRSTEPVEIIGTSNHGMEYVNFLFFITSFKLIRLIKH